MDTNLTKVEEKEIQIFNPEADIERAKIAAKALMTVVEQTKPLTLGGKKYLYFEHWQTIGQFFNHSTGTEWTKPIMAGDKIIGYEAKAVLYNREGVVVGGAEAACMNDEMNWKNKPLFQLRSMAQTRAMAKALRSRFGFVPVLVGIEATPAEEINGEAFVGNEFSKPKNTKTPNSLETFENAGGNCSDCGEVINEKVRDYSVKFYKKALCYDCQERIKLNKK